MNERVYSLKITGPIDQESEDYQFKVFRDNTTQLTVYTDCMMPGLERFEDVVARDLGNDPL